MKDPLSDSMSNLAKLREHCKGIVIRELDAGNLYVPLLVVYIKFMII